MKKNTESYDIIIVSAEPFVDHPFSGVGILKRVLEDKGYSVAVIETPDWKRDNDFLRHGKPRLFFAVSSGAMDSMVVNYTPMKKLRQENAFSRMSYSIPDRAVTVYCNKLKQLFKETKIVIGGTESSLRRFGHYDFWENRIRKSILLDTRADILAYGYGEKQIVEIAKRIEEGKELFGIDGTCIVSKEVPEGFKIMPSFDEVVKVRKKFCEMQMMIMAEDKIAQKFDNRYVLQNKPMDYTTKDLDHIYSLNYSRKIPARYPEFNIVRFSVLTHRGCVGRCNFCSISANGSGKIMSRSEESIIDEIKKISKMEGFNGTIELSGASANMYGTDCEFAGSCKNYCLACNKLDKSHKRAIELLRKARQVKGVRQVIIKSGVRFDLAMHSPEYIREIIKYHIDGALMIAPEHVNQEVLRLMNKENSNLKAFVTLFNKIAAEENKKVKLSYYIMIGHPGCNVKNSHELRGFTKHHENTNFVQVFTPTPMTVSTAMYYTGMDPKTMKEIYVPYTYNEKKKQKNVVMGELGANESEPEKRRRAKITDY